MEMRLQGWLTVALVTLSLGTSVEPATAVTYVDPDLMAGVDAIVAEKPDNAGASGDVWILGDVNGDGVEDFAINDGETLDGANPLWVVFGRTDLDRRSTIVAERPGFRIDSIDGWFDDVVALGDANGDGFDDFSLGTQTVIYGGADLDGVLRTDALGQHGVLLRCGPPNSVLESIQPVGDRDGDLRDEFAVALSGETRVLELPPGARGSVDVCNLSGTVIDNPDGVEPSRLELERSSDFDGDGRPDLWGWAKTADEGLLIAAALDIPASGRVGFDELLAHGQAWYLRSAADEVQVASAIGDHNRDGRGELQLGLKYDSGWSPFPTTVPGPAGGTTTVLAPETRWGFEFKWRGRALADLDGDGHAESALDDWVALSDGDWKADYTFSPAVGGEYRVIGTARDLDGDGVREVVTRGSLWHDFDHPRTWAHVIPSRVLRALPPFRPPELAPIPAPTIAAPVRAAEPPVAPVRIWPGTPPELAATPEYVRGRVHVRLRAPRMAQVRTVTTVRPWRGTERWPLPNASATARFEPWAALDLALPLPARASLERDGRLRASLRSETVTASGRLLTDDVEFIIVTRRAAAQSVRRPLLKGSFGRQRLRGTELAELLRGESGADLLRGDGGDDVLRGGTGNDRLLGGAGADRLDGDDGDDELHGEDGRDELVEQRFGDDSLYGGAGDDVLYAGRGEDQLDGGPGDDVLAGGSGPDVVDCGPGEDVVLVNFNAERRHLRSCEHVYEEPGVVHVPCVDGGTNGPETVLGTEQDDRCAGLGGDDDLEGRGGNDVLDGGPGNDRLFGRYGRDVLRGGEGADELEGGGDADVLDGGSGNDHLNGGYAPDIVRAGPGNDRIIARGGGADRIDCGPGTDVAIVDSTDGVRNCERVDRSQRH